MINYTSIVTATATAAEHTIMQMDPQLQRIVLMRRTGFTKSATASTQSEEIAVIAKVSDSDSWFKLTEVRSGVTIGKTDDNKSEIVTGRIPIKRVEFIRSLPFVKSLKAARKLVPALFDTTREIEAGKLIPASAKVKGGKGAIVGIIDFGCDFAHKNFLAAPKKTRILHFWEQAGRKQGTEVKYGRVYTQAEMNKALSSTDPYKKLGYEPESEAHGTHVMDIASGNGKGTKVAGVAPEADIIFVELDSSDVPDEGTDAVGKNFGDSVHLLEALKFIFEKAGEKPCVINVSLGTNGGPHDGTTLVEQGIDSLLKDAKNKAIVIAASNSFGDGIHAAGTVPAKGTIDIPWIVAGNDRTENEMEIWYKGAARLSAEVIDPQGKSLGVVVPGESGTENDTHGDTRLFISNRLDDPNNHDNTIGLWLKKGSAGKWIIRLSNQQNTKVDYHAWIERDNNGQSSFMAPLDNTHTLGSISCSKLSIVVGSYDAHRPDTPISWFSSSGPTRDGRQKPEVSAPGHEVIAAESLSGNGVIEKSGTSQAAPAVTGSIAVLLAEAKSRKKDLSIEDIRKIVIASARRNPPANGKDLQYGAGRISLKNMINLLGAGTGISTSKKTGSKTKSKSKTKKRSTKKVKGGKG